MLYNITPLSDWLTMWSRFRISVLCIAFKSAALWSVFSPRSNPLCFHPCDVSNPACFPPAHIKRKGTGRGPAACEMRTNSAALSACLLARVSVVWESKNCTKSFVVIPLFFPFLFLLNFGFGLVFEEQQPRFWCVTSQFQHQGFHFSFGFSFNVFSSKLRLGPKHWNALATHFKNYTLCWTIKQFFCILNVVCTFMVTVQQEQPAVNGIWVWMVHIY